VGKDVTDYKVIDRGQRGINVSKNKALTEPGKKNIPLSG
jgi:hypothetical protein